MGNESNQIVKGALLLTVAGLFSKILSAGYRIPLQNLTGDIGFYIYQQVYPILGMAGVLALYGFPTAISKIAVDIKAAGKHITWHQFYLPLFTILLSVNGLISLLLFLNADALAHWVGDYQLRSSYQFVAIVFLFIPFTAVLRGGFQGHSKMKPTAYSQVGEQTIRVFIIILAAIGVSIYEKNLYTVGQVASIASVCGSITAIIILGYFFIKKKPKRRDTYRIPWKKYVRTLILFGMIASLTHLLLLIVQMVDSMTIISSLKEYGLAQIQAMELKGIFDRGQPLIQLGVVLGSSFALAFIPSLTKAKITTESDSFYDSIQRALALSFYIASGATIGLLIIFPEVNILLYQDNQGIISLRILAVSILLSSAAIMFATILQGMGYLKQTAILIVGMFVGKWFFNKIFVSHLGIVGSALATVLSLLLLCVVSFYELHRKLPRLALLRTIHWSSFSIATLTMSVYLFLMKWLLPVASSLSRVELLLVVVFIVLTGGCLYLLLLIRLGALTKKELEIFPCSTWLIRFVKEEKK